MFRSAAARLRLAQHRAAQSHATLPPPDGPPATDAQVGYLVRLLAEVSGVDGRDAGLDRLTLREASALISELLRRRDGANGTTAPASDDC